MNQQNMKTSFSKQSHILAMPYPGRGHINPMLNLCKLILSKSKHVFITFVVTQEWHSFLNSEAQCPLPDNFQYAVLPQVIPSEIGRAADFHGFVEAVLTKLQDPFELLLDGFETPPTAMIYDSILAWVVGVGKQRNIPLAAFISFSASYFTLLYHFDLLVQHGHFPLNVSERGHEIVDYIPGLPSTTIADLPTIFHGNGNKLLHRMLKSVSLNNAQYMLITSVYEFEEQTINCLKAKLPIPLYHIGPMIPYFNLTNKTIQDDTGNQNYFKWLDSQPRGSVLYISQGSFLSASSDQVEEIIAGIRESNVRFLWVTRDDSLKFRDGDDNNSDDKGFLVPWCDQLRVLCHPCVGGFWTHCGWNSTAEGIYAGVPMLTCPIFWDQFPNSKMIVNDMKIGWRVIDNDHLKSGELVTRHEIAQLVRRFMDGESDERKEMVRRAKEVQGIMRKAIANGGSAASNFDAFLNSILQVNNNNNK